MTKLKSLLPLLLLLTTGTAYRTATEVGVPDATDAANTKVATPRSQATAAPRSWAKLKERLWADTKTMLAMQPLSWVCVVCFAWLFGKKMGLSFTQPYRSVDNFIFPDSPIAMAMFIVVSWLILLLGELCWWLLPRKKKAEPDKPLAKWQRVRRALAYDLARYAMVILALHSIDLMHKKPIFFYKDLKDNLTLFFTLHITFLVALLLQKLLWGALVLKEKPATKALAKRQRHLHLHASYSKP